MFKKFIKITYFLHLLLENLVIDKYTININSFIVNGIGMLF